MTIRSRAALSALSALTVAAWGAVAAPASGAFAAGAAGLGDPFFPAMGNGGYQVSHYDLRLRHSPGTGELVAKATITATATQDLSAFNLDYAGPRVGSVEVGGVAAAFARDRRELVVTPTTGIPTGATFVIEVAYGGHPEPIFDPDGSREGWFPTDDGAFVVGEPIGSVSWYPSNNTPTDKASFSFRVSVPHGFKAIANGALVGISRGERRTKFRWHESEPMATYLATVAIGRYRLERSRTAGIPSITAIDSKIDAREVRALRSSGAILRLFADLFGPYPFAQTGAIVDRAEEVGYALETQTRPIYDRPPSDILLAHELAHQWFGDSVTPSAWPDIWLNEGFATWAEWRWEEERGGPTTAKTFAKLVATPAKEIRFWNPPPGVPGTPDNLFAESIYVRGAMTLEALRQQVGDAAFLATLREWAATHRYGNATTEEFIALAEAQSGQQLDSLFATWLEQPGKPVP